MGFWTAIKPNWLLCPGGFEQTPHFPSVGPSKVTQNHGNLNIYEKSGLGLLLVQWLDVYTHAPQVNPLVEPAAYRPGVIRAGMKLPPTSRVGEPRATLSAAVARKVNSIGLPEPLQDCLFAREALFDDCNLLDGIPKTDGFFSLYLAEAKRITDLLPAAEVRGLDLVGLKDFLGVGRLAIDVHAGAKGLVWAERPSASPLVTAGQRPVFVSEATAWKRLTSQPALELGQTVLLPLEAQPLVSIINDAAAKVLPGKYSPQRLSFEVESPGPALVTIAQAFYPPWRARVDGRSAPLWRANYAFQALEVPAGRHRVVVGYEDDILYWGTAISAVFLTIVGWLWFWPPPRDASLVGSERLKS